MESVGVVELFQSLFEYELFGQIITDSFIIFEINLITRQSHSDKEFDRSFSSHLCRPHDQHCDFQYFRKSCSIFGQGQSGWYGY